jgi:hypothetical protein
VKQSPHQEFSSQQTRNKQLTEPLWPPGAIVIGIQADRPLMKNATAVKTKDANHQMGKRKRHMAQQPASKLAPG